MIPHETIPPLSTEWWIYNILTTLSIITIIYLGKRLSIKNKNQLTVSLAIIFIIEFFVMEGIHIYHGIWSLQDSLPIHLCSIMWFFAIYMFLFQKQWTFEILLFIGLPGGIHSLLTPELTHGGDLLHKIDFFIAHGGLVLAPFYAIFVLGMWPRKSAWITSFFRLQLVDECTNFK